MGVAAFGAFWGFIVAAFYLTPPLLALIAAIIATAGVVLYWAIIVVVGIILVLLAAVALFALWGLYSMIFGGKLTLYRTPGRGTASSSTLEHGLTSNHEDAFDHAGAALKGNTAASKIKDLIENCGLKQSLSPIFHSNRCPYNTISDYLQEGLVPILREAYIRLQRCVHEISLQSLLISVP